ncbi:MAG: hypothetical protein HY744_10270 [Deltaproteobacteria bacterium]|nr:hypothetical protein [Deltaproteobacteria bacterium]
MLASTLPLLGGCTTVEPDPCPLTIWCSFTLPVCDDSPEPAVVSGSGACRDATFSCGGDDLCRESCVFANRGGICKVEVTVGSNHYSTQVELVETRECYSKYTPPRGPHHGGGGWRELC